MKKMSRCFTKFLILLTVLCLLSIPASAAASSIKLNRAGRIIYKGVTIQLKATVVGKSKTVVWRSSNSSVAAVSSTGKVTGKKAGQATITATANGKTAKCVIKVLNPSIKLNRSTAAMYESYYVSLKATVYGPSKRVIWKSSNPAVAAVSSKGTVVGKKAGTAVITATANGKTASCKVTVKASKVKYYQAYAAYLSKYPALYISDSNYYDASYCPSNTNYISCFALRDINGDNVPELITRKNVNFRWSVIKIFTYKAGKVQPVKFYSGGNVEFQNRATAAGGYYFYICSRGHVHNDYSCGWACSKEVYVNSSGTLRRYLYHEEDDMLNRNVSYKYNTRITASQFTSLTKACTASQMGYYSNNAAYRAQLKAGTIR